MNSDLEMLGEAIHAATERDLAVAMPRRAPLRGLVVVGVALALIVPAAGYAAGFWPPRASPRQEQTFLPRGEAVFAGTHPHCRASAPDGFHCVLRSAPTAESAATWLGAKEASVDAKGRINGGCVSLNQAGTAWNCYLGRAAVDHGILTTGLLGAHRGSPGRG